MTRRLRLAGVGLGALLMPACIGSRGSTEPPPSSRIMTGYVVMDRSGVQPPGSRYARSGSASPAASLDPTKPITPRDVVKTEVSKVSEPRLPDPMTDLPPMPPPVVTVKHEKPAPRLEAEDLMIPPERRIETPAVGLNPIPAPIEPAAAEVRQHVDPRATPDEPIRRPEWPVFGSREGEKPTLQPELTPRVDAQPPPTPAPHEMSLIRDPEPMPPTARENVSLKIETPATMEQNRAPAPNDSMLLQAIRAFQANRPQDAVDCLRNLDPANQELLMSLMPLMVRLCEKTSGSLPPEEVAMVVDRLQSASGSLKSRASLRLDRVCFCRGVRKFADIDPYEPGHEFHAGDMVFLYAELKNFTCEPAVAASPLPGYNATTRGCNIRLSTTLELRDERQNLIWRTDLTKTDYSLTPPQDYYHTYRFCIPETLPAGTYTLWLNVTDKPTGRAIRKSVEMRVAQN